MSRSTSPVTQPQQPQQTRPMGFNAISVKDMGALGDGATDDTVAIQAAIDACFGPAPTPNGGNAPWKNIPLYFPGGRYIISKPLVLTAVSGGWIFGTSRMASRIIQNTAGSAVFTSNGMQYSRVENLFLQGATNSICFDLNWNGNQTNGCALQSNTFSDMFFSGGDYGLKIGAGGFMGSENEARNCFFNQNAIAGMSTWNANACCNAIRGGDIQGCGVGVQVQFGSIPVIDGLSCQLSGQWDIQLIGDANDATCIRGVRTESANFLVMGGTSCSVVSCNQTGPSGTFVNLAQTPAGLIAGCVSLAGQVVAGGETRATIQNSQFGRMDWSNFAQPGEIDIFNVRYNGLRDSGPGTGGFQFISAQRVTPIATQNYVVQ